MDIAQLIAELLGAISSLLGRNMVAVNSCRPVLLQLCKDALKMEDMLLFHLERANGQAEVGDNGLLTR